MSEHFPPARRLVELVTPFAMRLGATGVIPYPNPIGVPRP